MSALIRIITATDPHFRDQSLDAFCRGASSQELLDECESLERFRSESKNLYERVRALFFLYAIHRYHLPTKPGMAARALIPYEGYTNLLNRRFEEAIEIFRKTQREQGANDGISSALAESYHRLGFQILADQVRKSVRSVRGNQWMFRTGHTADQPLRIRPDLFKLQPGRLLFPILREATPVRMDLTHSGWSDIFFLGMDFPEAARVINISVDLSVRDSDGTSARHLPRPPVEAYFRIIDKPVLRLVSVDLSTSAEITTLAEIFDFAKDYLGLLKAAIISSGIVPPGMEGAEQPLSDLLGRLGRPGHGIELVSRVNGIPKGSRLAVSTNLLASLISVCMRATGQTHALMGELREDERRQVAARAILGEWLAGSGGGWQDSGGVWPGIKLIQGVVASETDPEFGISRGRLLPEHIILTDMAEVTRQRLQDSLVLVHGGMAQDVGPVLEMVTEKYLLRSEAEWRGRRQAMELLNDILKRLKSGDIKGIGSATQRNFDGPIQTIIPWASNLYTETLIQRVQSEFGEQFWGFWMLGGMSGGGMGFIFDPARKSEAQSRLQEIMSETKRALESAVPFAMEPVVYDFSVNERGSCASMVTGPDALMPAGYYPIVVPELLRLEPRNLSATRRAELDRFSEATRTEPEMSGMVQTLFDHLLPRGEEGEDGAETIDDLLERLGFDRVEHEQVRSDLKNGRIGLAQNRLPVNSQIVDAEQNDVFDATGELPQRYHDDGMRALAAGELAVVSMAGGAGSRWTQGAGVVKALNPFCNLSGKHRTFIEAHLAKSRHTSHLTGTYLPHVITTSYMTHEPIEGFLKAEGNYGYEGPLILSHGRAVGLRLIPTARDLRFTWEELPQRILDDQAQKVQDSMRAALISWAESSGEATDYTDNLPRQCLHPVGHWYEIPNLLRNGVLANLLNDRPGLKYLMVHNIDTLGANVDPALLGWHINSDAALTTEVITRRIDDRGGGLARVNGNLRLIEGLALPREEVEFDLSYYNTSTTWIDIDRLLAVFGLGRSDLGDEIKMAESVRSVAARMPTYITLKDVKKRWGKGQEDIYPVIQFEKLWGDMTALPELSCRYVAVPRMRGQQLKDSAQLDGWLRDLSAAYLESLCDWT